MPIECEFSSDGMQSSTGAFDIEKPTMHEGFVVSRPFVVLPMFASVLFLPSITQCPGPPGVVCGTWLPGSATS